MFFLISLKKFIFALFSYKKNIILLQKKLIIRKKNFHYVCIFQFLTNNKYFIHQPFH